MPNKGHERWILNNFGSKFEANPTHIHTLVFVADDWNCFITCTSCWAAEGLVEKEVLETWRHYVAGYSLHLQTEDFTDSDRERAATHLRRYAAGVEEIFGTRGCIISLHLVAVEADHQIPQTGPIRESMAAWVERLNFTLVEQIQRR